MRVFIAGQVVGAEGVRGASAHCKWRLVAGSAWQHVAGLQEGMSQSDTPAEAGVFVFQQPMEVCFEATGSDPSAHEWPRIELELRWRDAYDRSDLAGYAVVHVPSAPGDHSISCRVWRPRGSFIDRLSAFFVGGYPHLKDPALVYGLGQAVSDEETGGTSATGLLMRQASGGRLTSEPAGVVHLRLGVLRLDGHPIANEN